MSLKILLADDSMTAQNMGKKILVEAGFTVIAVSNGSMAMKKIASEKPDILVLDVFMPGYSGLEVCEKVKGAPGSAHTPVILTVGKMEPFRPEEGNKVKADGLIIKPFEASDLVAAVQKLAAKLNASAAAEAEKTLKMAAPAEEIKDAGYEEWKTAADTETGDAEAPAKFSVPQDMTGAAAFDIPPEESKAETGEMQVQALPSTSSWGQTTDAPVSTSPWGSEAVTSALDTAAPSWAEPSKPVETQEPSWSAADSLAELHPTTHQPAELPSLQPEPLLETSGSPAGFDSALSATAPGLEVTTASGEEVVAPPAPGFEAGFGSGSAAGADLRASTDPSLLTDQTKMVSEFSTRFGVENAEPTPVGVAEHMLEETPATEAPLATEIAPTREIPATTEAAPVTEIEPAPAVEQPVAEAPAPPVVDEAEQAAILAREMHQAFANVTPEPPSPEPAAVEAAVPPPPPPVEPATSGGDQEFANALQAAISGAPVAPPEPMEAAPAFDPQMVSRAVDRVLDRFKGELMAEIMRELKR